MATIKEAKRSVTIWALMGIFVITAVLGLVMFLPAAYAGEEFEYIRCYSGTYTSFHKSKELPMLLSWQENGIIMSQSENKFLHNATVHSEGVQLGVGKKRKGYAVTNIIDPDGDMIILAAPYTGFVSEGKFLQGTGKYKGIKGSFKSQRVVRSRPGKSAMPGTYQGCRRCKGTFELPPK